MSTRERLVEAAEELMWERGYSATSPAAIQQRAGAGQGSMYHHFRGKGDLARQALTAQAEQLDEALDVALGSAASAPERLLAYLAVEREPLRGCRLGREAQDPDVVAEPELHAVVADYFTALTARLADVVRAGQAAGELDPVADPERIATLLVTSLQGGYVLARATGDQAAFATATAAAADVVRGLDTRGAAR